MTNVQRELRHIRIAILVCFFLSGLTGLVYEVLWIRSLGLVFGQTVFAITTVLTAFMAGLGLGSLVFGRRADRWSRPLLVYGVLEVAIGISCLLVPWALRLIEMAYVGVTGALQLSFLSLTVMQFVVVLLLLLVPTTLMGATLPVLSRHFVLDASSLSRRVGLLYALNTFGAVLGAALAGYFMLPTFGMAGSLHLAATVSVGVGVLALFYDRTLKKLAMSGALSDSSDATTPTWASHVIDSPRAPERSWAATAVVGGLALSGAASMIYEVAWTRALALVIGSSTYAFTAMLLAFLGGIAAGSALFSKLWGDRRTTPAGFAAIQLGVGASAMLILPLFERLPSLYLQAFNVSLNANFISVAQIALSIVIMFVPTLLIGSSFPCVLKLAARGLDHVSVDVGRIYAINTAGAIAGTVLAGFILLPLIGAHSTIKAAVLLNIAAGTAVAFGPLTRVSRRGQSAIAALALAAVAGVVWLPTWNAALMTSGVAIYGDQYRRFPGSLSEVASKSTLLYYEDGLGATVSVHRDQDLLYLRVNGKTDASTGADMHTQLMAAHIPLLIHPNPKNVLVIGLGSGVTVGAAAQHPVERIDVVEIEPAVVRASKFFAPQNRGVLRDPRVHVVIADGRNFLLSTSRRYDVIISEPSNPWIRGLATLFTEEFYQLARTRLHADGLMLQWVQGYRIDPADLRMVVRTYRQAFPAVSIWHALGADYFLLGSQASPLLDFGRIEAAYRSMPTFREDMERSGLRSPHALLADFLLGEVDTARYARLGLINTDDLLPLEFSAPRMLHADTSSLNFKIMQGFRSVELPNVDAEGRRRLESVAGRYQLGLAYLQRGMRTEAQAHFEKALAQDPRHVPSLVGVAKIEQGFNRPLQAMQRLEAALRYEPRNPELHSAIAQVYQTQKILTQAIAASLRAIELKPAGVNYRVQLARLLREEGRYDEAIKHFRLALESTPTDPATLVDLGLAYLAAQRPAAAVSILDQAQALRPSDSRILHELGRAYLALNDPARAIPLLHHAAIANPALAPLHVDLGMAQLAAGQLGPARSTLERGLSLDPTQARAAQALADVYQRLDGQP